MHADDTHPVEAPYRHRMPRPPQRARRRHFDPATGGQGIAACSISSLSSFALAAPHQPGLALDCDQ